MGTGIGSLLIRWQIVGLDIMAPVLPLKCSELILSMVRHL